MNTVQNGKGDKARNNWGESWYAGFDAINWHRKPARSRVPVTSSGASEDSAQSERRSGAPETGPSRSTSVAGSASQR